MAGETAPEAEGGQPLPSGEVSRPDRFANLPTEPPAWAEAQGDFPQVVSSHTGGNTIEEEGESKSDPRGDRGVMPETRVRSLGARARVVDVFGDGSPLFKGDGDKEQS